MRPPRLPSRGLLLSGLALACALTVPPAAAAADPIMALSDVRSGMRCTALTVIRGVEPVPFDVEVIDVVAGDVAAGAPRLLVEASGPAVAATGIGQGFSGSPIYCPGADGVPRVAGAISESVGEYGGKVVLATPIEAVLGVPVETPADAAPVPGPTLPLAAPLVVSGLDARLARRLEAAARRSGVALQAVPAVAPAGFPERAPGPGTAMAAGLAAGDVSLSAVGTVTYVDDSRLWGFGHALDGLGRRSLLLQDAYVYRVINHPLALGDLASTYKLAAPGRIVGELTGDGLAAVSGRVGASPPHVPVSVRVREEDTGRSQDISVVAADETSAGNPAGISPVTLAAPIAVAQGASGVLGAVPPQLSADMCARIAVREMPRLRICNRYVSRGGSGGLFGFENAVALAAADDLDRALARIDSFTYAALRVRAVSVSMSLRRGPALELLREVSLPARARAGQRIRVRLTTQVPRGRFARHSFRVRLPRNLEPGRVRLTFSGPGADGADLGETLISLTTPPASARAAGPHPARAARVSVRREIARLARRIRGLSRYDGVRMTIGGRRGSIRAYRDEDMRISGRRSDTLRVLRPRRR